MLTNTQTNKQKTKTSGKAALEIGRGDQGVALLKQAALYFREDGNVDKGAEVSITMHTQKKKKNCLRNEINLITKIKGVGQSSTGFGRVGPRTYCRVVRGSMRAARRRRQRL